MWNNARQRAKQNGLDFDLPLEWVKEKFEKGTCDVTGIPFSDEVGTGKGQAHPFSPSLDRTDPTQGYTVENTAVVVWIYNCAKHVSSHEDVLRMARALIYPQVDNNDR
jgi:hypothetical protein